MYLRSGQRRSFKARHKGFDHLNGRRRPSRLANHSQFGPPENTPDDTSSAEYNLSLSVNLEHLFLDQILSLASLFQAGTLPVTLVLARTVPE